MRRAAKVDRNQPDIVLALRQVGASVTPTHMVGRGFPDIVCGFRGRSYPMEIKDGSLPPSAQKLTPDEAAWHAKWKGDVYIVRNVQEAVDVVLGRKEKPCKQKR